MKTILYCLTCDPYRKAFMEKQFIKHNINYNFYDAVTIQSLINFKNIVSPIQDVEDRKFLETFRNIKEPIQIRSSQVSISMGHYFITKKFIESDNDLLIVCEDDIVFIDSNIDKIVRNYVEKENIIDKPFVIYGCTTTESRHKLNDNKLIKCGERYGNPCYIINKKFAHHLLTNFFPITTAYDDYLNHIMHNNNNVYFYTSPFLCYELSSHYYEMYYTPDDIIARQSMCRLSYTDIQNNMYHAVNYRSYSDDMMWNELSSFMLKNKKKNKYVSTNNNTTYHLLFGGSLKHSNNHSIICGAGIKNQTDPIIEPYIIISCRGPLTRKRIMEYGWFCPENYGDPGLLISHFYPMPLIDKVDKTHRIAVIVSNNNFINKIHNLYGNDIIFMVLTINDMEQVINNKIGRAHV